MITNKTKFLEELEELEEDTLAKPFVYHQQLIQQPVHHFYISTDIGEAHLYVDMIHQIRMAGPGEVVYIHLNVCGGILATGVQIINAMESSAAHIVVSVESECHSLGTLIFLAADEFVVHDDCMMMFHNFSGGGAMGKGHEQISQLEATVKWFQTMARKRYIPFMSEDEFQSMVDGKDIWMLSDEIRERLHNMVEILEAEKVVTES